MAQTKVGASDDVLVVVVALDMYTLFVLKREPIEREGKQLIVKERKNSRSHLC